MNQLVSNLSEVVGGAFSFFGKRVVDENFEGHDIIYRHEEIHSTHVHPADTILWQSSADSTQSFISVEILFAIVTKLLPTNSPVKPCF